MGWKLSYFDYTMKSLNTFPLLHGNIILGILYGNIYIGNNFERFYLELDNYKFSSLCLKYSASVLTKL